LDIELVFGLQEKKSQGNEVFSFCGEFREDDKPDAKRQSFFFAARGSFFLGEKGARENTRAPPPPTPEFG
jgi:hypothetical protein